MILAKPLQLFEQLIREPLLFLPFLPLSEQVLLLLIKLQMINLDSFLLFHIRFLLIALLINLHLSPKSFNLAVQFSLFTLHLALQPTFLPLAPTQVFINSLRLVLPPAQVLMNDVFNESVATPLLHLHHKFALQQQPLDATVAPISINL